MDAQHASRGRRTLEEIRQKRAAERLHNASSGSDAEIFNPYGASNLRGENRPSEDSYALIYRTQELENVKSRLENENQKLRTKLEEKEADTDSLIKRLGDLEQNSLPSLRKAVKDLSIEKDAVFVAKEDALAQLRTIKKQLKEAEEEQYRAEEDAAALRAELNNLQRQGFTSSFGGNLSSVNSVEDTLAMEREIEHLRSLLQQESLLRQQEQQKLSEEQIQLASLMASKQELEDKLAVLSKRASEDSLNVAAHKEVSLQAKEKYDKQLHDLATMVERLEGSRQKLLAEIDSQSSEIERLFEENSILSASHKDALGVAAEWEKQVNNCLKQNEALRLLLDKTRAEQINLFQQSNGDAQVSEEIHGGTENSSDCRTTKFLNHSLQEQLAKEQSRAEALAADVMKLTAELKLASQSYCNLARLYKPVLRDIENGLMKMKQESFVAVQL